MLTVEELVFIINVFCGIRDSKISQEQKIHCIEYMTNCSVGYAGQISNKKVNECKTVWADEERRQYK